MHAVLPTPASHSVNVGRSTGPAASGPWHLRAEPPLATVAETVRALFRPHLGSRLLPAASPLPAPEITLALDPEMPAGRRPFGAAPDGSLEHNESYALRVTAEGITCRASTLVGVFRAATTALQLITLAGEGQLLPVQDWSDSPHYAWRGLMVDPARRFIPVEELRALIDLAALYKLNVLHVHLTDNEGWRIEIPSLPELTAREASGSGFYTAAQYQELQQYAADRFITLVPELDLPGHCAALRTAVPDLPPAPAPPGLAGRFPYTPPLDLADPRTRDVVHSVFSDLCAMTTGPFVHIGADEALGITEEGFALAVDELRTMLRALGKRPLAWQESSRAGVSGDDIAQYWVDPEMMDLPETEEELAQRPDLADAGFTGELLAAFKRFFAPTARDVQRVLDGGGLLLLSPQSHLYLDRRYSADVAPHDRTEQAATLGFPSYRPRSVRYTAAWDPTAHGIPDDRVAGVEATLFAENFQSFDELTTLLLPRLASVASIAWNGRPEPWASHRQSLAHHSKLWRERRLAYFPSTDVDWQ